MLVTDAAHPDPAADAAASAAAASLVARRFAPLCAAAGAEHECEVVRFLTDAGSVGDAVAARAQDLNASLVAIASHHSGRLATWVRGSVSAEVSRRASVPVLLVQ